MYARLVADAATLRQNVEDLLTRVLAGGETDLVPRLVHPDFVNHEASPERHHGPKGAAATSQWLRSCFGDLRYEIHHIFIDDHMTAAYVTMSGTHEGGLPPGLPATHKPFAVKHVHLIRFRATSERRSWHAETLAWDEGRASVGATTRSPCRLHGLLRVSQEGPSESRQVGPHRQTSSASSAGRRVLRPSKAEARRLACLGLGRLLLFVRGDSALRIVRRYRSCLNSIGERGAVSA